MPRPGPAIDPRTISPLRYLAVSIAGIFVAEVVVMVLIPALGIESRAGGVLFDASFIAVIVFLFNYRFMARPLIDSLHALRDSEERFRDYAETASDWFWEMDAELRFSFVSDHPGKEGMLGGTLEAFAEGASAEEMARQMALMGERRAFRSFECGARGADGAMTFLRLSGKPLISKGGAFLGYRGTATDITQERRSRAELEQINRNLSKLAEDLNAQREKAEAASLAKSQFLANMSHELRTPLNAIIGFSEIIKDEVLGPVGIPKYREYATDIFRSGDHLLELIKDVLDMSKIEAGKYELQFTEVAVRPLVEECLRLVVGRAVDSGVVLANAVCEGGPPVVADRRGLKQIVLNLVTNAIKFTPRGGSVTVSAGVADGWYALSVADTGIGMSADEIARAVQPFVQIEREKGRNHEGTGLGLALAKSLIEMHGGELGIASEVGVGTTCTIRLPMTPGRAAAPSGGAAHHPGIVPLTDPI
jgi:two-component system cell cycle sensor histidine kinase PleC